MFGSTILDVAIGLVFVYLLLSLIVTAGTELIASWLNWRADNLRKGLQRLLNPTLAQELYDHPLIKNLSKSGRWPSYIPAGTFALALVDVIANLNPGDLQPAKDLGSLISNVPDPDVRRVLGLLAEEAGQDGQRLKENIENWFNSSMDRVAGWYKRKTQVVNMILAIVLTVAVNADSILIVRSLSNDSALRAALVTQAQELARGTPVQPETGQPGTGTKAAVDELEKRFNKLSGLGVPLGWTDGPGDSFRQWPGWLAKNTDTTAWAAMWWPTARYHFLGWVLTALAASLGAPFWFDMLNKIITVRSTGKVPEEQPKRSKEEPKS